jgi:hypothetical protein
LFVVASTAAVVTADTPQRLLLIGGKGSHGPGAHEHMPGLRILAKCLAGVPDLDVSLHQADGKWPAGIKLLDKADGIVLFLDEGAKWEQATPRRRAALERLANRGGGVVAIHWAIGGKDTKYIPFHLNLLGGCHGGPDRKYTRVETDVKVVAPDHPITRGLEDFRLADEYYYGLKFAEEGTITPLLAATINGGPETCAWAYERPDGGRSFGFCGMHFHQNWQREECRRLIVQGILWTLDLPTAQERSAVE